MKMADITMCKAVLETSNEGEITVCSQKDKCYRHIAPVTPEWQSWFIVAPGKFFGAMFSCDYFWNRETD
jgi:hypothetical protein